tara:strand:+ start:248 stop:730 length:483 start_codon:yes stop_codon:yes gene_type:complete
MRTTIAAARAALLALPAALLLALPVALALALPVALAPSPVAAAEPCPAHDFGDGTTTLSKDGATVIYRTVPAEIAVGQPFSVEAVACRDDKTAATAIRLDAGMPAHGHGMNYAPSERKLGPGHSAFDGLVFHMPGRWQMTFDVYEGERRTRLDHAVTVGR